jgi:hypothetical protein
MRRRSGGNRHLHGHGDIPDSDYLIGGTFIYSNSVTITQGVATCEMSAPISVGYDGSAHTNVFTVTTGLAWSVSYSPSTPVNPGTYDATVTMTGDATIWAACLSSATP